MSEENCFYLTVKRHELDGLTEEIEAKMQGFRNLAEEAANKLGMTVASMSFVDDIFSDSIDFKWTFGKIGIGLHGSDISEQPPQANNNSAIWDLIVDYVLQRDYTYPWLRNITPQMLAEDMRARDNLGRKNYGTPLQAFNGRDPLWDGYQEQLDCVAYMRQHYEEHPSPESWFLFERTLKDAVRIRSYIETRNQA